MGEVSTDQTTILVVEDNEDHAALIKAVFARGYQQARVHVAVRGEGAKRYLRGEWPSYEDDEEYCPLPTLMVLDLWLPDMTGLDILEWMRDHEQLSKIPVIMFTASTNPEHARRALALGVRRCLQKPAHFGDLVAGDRGVGREADQHGHRLTRSGWSGRMRRSTLQ